MTTNSKKYDYIIAGAGLAGLSLAYKLRQDPHFDEKSILLVDQDAKNKNDRTWCFWSKDKDCFDALVYHSWDNLSFKSDSIDKAFKAQPYRYKMIRGIDFYKHTLAFLKGSPNTDFVQDTIQGLETTTDTATLRTGSTQYTGDYIFKSYPDKLDQIKDLFVWQHFKGVIIETPEAQFNPDEAIFMDFRVAQDGETRFFYVLPTSPTRALIEIAIFSEEIPDPSFYDPYIAAYMKDKLGIANYTIVEEELGAIPMTTHNFQDPKPSRLKSIGTNGGSVKASSGYAFSRIQKHVDQLIMAIKKDAVQKFSIPKSRYQLYDRIMLNAILSGKTTGKEVFESLFENLSMPTVFKFLDEEKSILNDLKIVSAPPKLPFIKAFLEEILKK